MEKPTYCWEFGIDWKTVKKGDAYYLQPGFARKDCNACDPVPDNPTRMPAGSKVNIIVFDTTKSEPLTESIQHFQWSFMNARGGAPDSPFLGMQVESPLVAASLGVRHSAALRGDFPAFAVSTSLSEGSAQTWELATAARGERFFFTAELEARNTLGEPRKFRVDPEMEVGENGFIPGNPSNQGCLWRWFHRS